MELTPFEQVHPAAAEEAKLTGKDATEVPAELPPIEGAPV